MEDGLLYQNFCEKIKYKILSGEYPPGKFMPSFRKLHAQYGLSLTTIARAFKILVEEGLIERGPHTRHGFKVVKNIPALQEKLQSEARVMVSPPKNRKQKVTIKVNNHNSDMPLHRVTCRDVANLAGVSCTTVSYVINGKTGGGIRISDETRKKVRQAIAQLNYRPNMAARTLRTNRSNIIALMVPYVDTPFGSTSLAAVQKSAEDHGLNLMVFASHDDVNKEKSLIMEMLKLGVEGFIAQTNNLLSKDIDFLVNAGVAVVILGNAPMHERADNVMIDEYQASWDVTAYLLKLGHKRIALVTGSEGTWYGKLRRKGYFHALQHFSIPVNPNYAIEVDSFDVEEGSRCIKKILDLNPRPTAAFIANDFIAVHGILYAIDKGIRIPEDLSIVGFDDVSLAKVIRPQLTTVNKQIEKMCKTAVSLLKERIETNKHREARHVFLDYSIVERHSVCPLKI
ncbi:MAG: GntR family transcriptional regulator [Bacteroidales bacterium]